MAQQFDYPKTETELRNTLDELFRISKEAHDAGNRPSFKGLLELITAETTVITAVHNIKSNHGSETPGVDGLKMREDYLYKPYKWVVSHIQEAFYDFTPQDIRRVYIDKPGKTEKRPLGIPTIKDRIMQECMRIVLEPICEGQFFEHSYGFRPMRDTAMALERIKSLSFHTGYYWVVEGDISKCFDRINHAILIKRLYHIGIKDRRVLQIIRAFLGAGIMGECFLNMEGTPQGGLISPLLANVYLDMLDEWVARQWEHKETTHTYASASSKYRALKSTNLIPGYIVRYADDFVILTDSHVHAEFWRESLKRFLKDNLKLYLSPTKTLLTDIRRKRIKFLGFEFKMVRGKSKKGYIPRTTPDRDRLKTKVNAIRDEIKTIPKNTSREKLIATINRINSKIRGIIQYYECCTWVSVVMKEPGRLLQKTAARRLKQYKGKWVQAKKVINLPRVHRNYKQKIPAIKYNDMYIGFTSLTFCKWQKATPKMQGESPYSLEGRQLNFERTKKKRIHAILDELYSDKTAETILHGKWDAVNNFEFIMNRAYALNRDRLKCRVCGKWILSETPLAHRINPRLPITKVNRVDKLASMHRSCFLAVNTLNMDISGFEIKAQKKIKLFREKLVVSHTATSNL